MKHAYAELWAPITESHFLILYCLLIFFIGFAFAHNVWVIVNIRWSISWIRAERRRTFTNRPETFVLILLPMLHEKDVAEETVRHFLSLDYDASLYKVLVITSARECNTQNETTSSVVQRLCSSDASGRIIHFHSDGSDTTKADQMNQALHWLNEAAPPWWTSKVVIGVYDADSRPELNSLRELDRAVGENPNDCAFQQPAMYLYAFDLLPRGLQGAYVRSRPLYNLRFCLFREIPGFLRSMIAARSTSNVVRTVLSSPNHFLGHGEFIRSHTLARVGGFPGPSADTSLGTMLSFMGHAFVPLSSFDIGQTPASISMLVRQGVTWYAGCARYPKDFALAHSKGIRPSLIHFVMKFKRWLENMIWAFGPILAVFLSIWTYLADDWVLFSACVFIGILHLASVLQILHFCLKTIPEIRIGKSLPSISRLEAISMVFAYPFMLLGSCLGPQLYYFYRLRSMLTGRPVPRSKTDRILG